MNELPGEIGYALGFVLGTIVKFGVDALNWVVAEVPKIITGIITFFTDLPGKIATEFMNVITKFGEWGSNVISWITTNVPNFIMGIVNFYAELPGKVYSFLTQVVTNMGTWISNMASKVASGIPGIVSSIINFFKDLPGDMLNIGENLVKGLWNGMTGMTTWLKDKIKEFADGVIHGMKDALGIHSPSRVMRDEVGLMIGLGMAAGIDDSIRQVKSAMARLNRNIVSDAEITTNANVTTQGSSNSRLGRITSSFTGPLLHVDKIVISNDMDIQELANKLGFYYKQVTAAKGGG
jgi:Phage-related protein